VRALPFALGHAAASPVSPLLAERFGTRVIMPGGMALMGWAWPTCPRRRAYRLPLIAVAVAIMGAGWAWSWRPLEHDHDDGARAPGRGGSADQRHDPGSRRRTGIAIVAACPAAPSTSPASAARWPRRTCPARDPRRDRLGGGGRLTGAASAACPAAS